MSSGTLPFALGGIGGASLSDDRQRLAIAGAERTEIVLCVDPLKGGPMDIGRVLTTSSKLTGAIHVSPSGTRILAPCESGVCVWRWESEEEDFTVPRAVAATFLDNDRIIAVRNEPAVEVALLRLTDDGGADLLKSIRLPASPGMNYQAIVPVSARGFVLNEFCPPDHERTYWIDPENLGVSASDDESVIAISRSGSVLAMSNGSRIEINDLKNRKVHDVSGTYAEEGVGNLVENCAFVGESSVVLRTEDRAFVHFGSSSGSLRHEDVSERVAKVAGVSAVPRWMYVANGSVVAIRYPDMTLLLDLADVVIG